MKKADGFAKWIMLTCSFASFLGIALIFFFILKESLPAFRELGPANLFKRPGVGPRRLRSGRR